MRISFALVLAGLFAAIGCGKRAPTAPALDGDYRMTKMCFMGSWVDIEKKRNLEMVIKGDTLNTSGGLFGGEAKETFSIKTDSSKTPATIDLTHTEDGKPETIPGIYKLDGDELTLSLGVVDEEKGEKTEDARPKDFTAGDKSLIFVLKRK